MKRPVDLDVANAVKSENIPGLAIVAKVHWDLISFKVENMVGFSIMMESLLDYCNHWTDMRVGHVDVSHVRDTGMTSACKSSLRTAKRPGLDWTGPEKNWTAVLVVHI
jgi:hypothetical protein